MIPYGSKASKGTPIAVRVLRDDGVGVLWGFMTLGKVE